MTQLQAQLLSIAIEAPVAAILVYLLGWPSRGLVHVALASAIGTSITHPLLWSAVEALTAPIGYWPAVVAGEAAVVLVEAAVLTWGAGLSPRRALVVSLSANAASALVGVLLAPLI